MSHHVHALVDRGLHHRLLVVVGVMRIPQGCGGGGGGGGLVANHTLVDCLQRSEASARGIVMVFKPAQDLDASFPALLHAREIEFAF